MLPRSILVIGASGRTGVECLRHFAQHPSRPRVHAFCRDPGKLGDKDKELCSSIIAGNARHEDDLREALRSSSADVVIVSLANANSVSATDLRTVSAKSLVEALQDEEDLRHVRVVVVSAVGAGPSRILIGWGIGSLLTFFLRHVLEDHTGQEKAFEALKDRVFIVRPTGLGDGHPVGKLVEFGDLETPPTHKTDRADLAAWIVEQAFDPDKPLGGQTVNVTGASR